MSRWLLVALFCLSGSGIAVAQQVGGAVNQGLNSDGGAMSAPGIDRVNGINANGTPRQLSPGSSMTNGAGNSTMTPGVVGGGVGATTPPPIGTVVPTINGKPATGQ